MFLLAGQSNMAGRGTVTPQDRTPHPRVLMLNQAGEWVPAVDPMHFDKPVAGVGPGRTFGIAIAEANPGVTIGLIPCAVGGSPIDAWQPGVLRPDEEPPVGRCAAPREAGAGIRHAQGHPLAPGRIGFHRGNGRRV